MAILKGTSFVQMIPNASVIVAGLTRFAGSFRSLKPALEDAVDGVLRPEIEEAFAAEGPGWAALDSKTIANRQSLGFSAGPILTRSGNLRRVATMKKLWHIDGQAGTAFVTDLPGAEYGVHHVTGTSYMPQRDFMGVSEEGMNQIEEIFASFIADNAGKYIASGIMVGR